MRYARDAKWIEHEGVFIGICLGADYCAEHEWGIKDLCHIFGIKGDTEPHGVARRRVSNVEPDKNLFFVETKKHTILIGDSSYEPEEFKENLESGKSGIFRELTLRGDLGTAWSGRDFGIIVSPVYASRVKELYEAFLRHDVAIFVGSNGGNPFANGGLTLLIASKIPQFGLDTMVEHDLEVERLKKASDATGIIAKLRATYNECDYSSGCRYFACSPRFFREGEKDSLAKKGRSTKYDVIYWLNPQEQQKNNFGWFTVEELEQWIEGKGPVPMKSK